MRGVAALVPIFLAVFLVLGCQDSHPLDPSGDAFAAVEGLEASTGLLAEVPGKAVPFRMRIASTDVWLNVLVTDDALGEDPDTEPDLVTVPPLAALGLTDPWVIVPNDFDGRCSGPALWVMHFTGEGTGTPLGRVTGNGSHCTYPPDQTGNMTYGDGESLSVAANGDELWIEYENGSGGYTEDPLVTTFEDDVMIVGGTGRFEDATGEGLERGVFDFAAAAFEMTIEGWISYEASNRS